METAYQLSEDLFIVRRPTGSPIQATPPAPEPTHHILVVDCSGSMWGDLPKIREQIKSKLVNLLAEDDTVTIIWFSGMREFGRLIGPIKATLKDLANISAAVDRWLRPVGMTGFKEPLQEVAGVITLLKATYKDPRISLFFMSDGWDNCWRKDEILSQVSALAGHVSAATMVEYGYYSDHHLLTRMAEKLGGSVILAQDFTSYEPIFETALRRRAPAPTRNTLTNIYDPVHGIVFALEGNEILTFEVDEKNRAHVPAHLTEVYYLSRAPRKGALSYEGVVDGWTMNALYASISLAAQRIQPKLVWSLLRVLGDVRLIDDFAICFGKQRYADFVATTKAAAFGDGCFVRGRDRSRAPKEDAFTILDLFDTIERTDGCRVLTGSDGFIYSRIGRKAVDKGKMLTVTEGKTVVDLATELTVLASSREVGPLKDVVAKINAILSDRKEALRFVPDMYAVNAGYPITLVWNETMPNLSFRVRIPGSVDLSSVEMSDATRKLFPYPVQTYQYRTYTVVKDGLVHIEWLPVVLTRAVYDTLVAVGVIGPHDVWTEDADGAMRGTIDMRKIPVINQRMIKETTARALFEKEWALLKLQGEAKVWKHYTPKRESKGFAQVYGADAAKMLEENGITDHSGFRVETTSAPAVDHYIGRALSVKIPGYSSLPSVKDVRERMEAQAATSTPVATPTPKKRSKSTEYTPSMKLMVPALCEVDALLASPFYQKAANKDAFFEQWVSDKAKATVAETRKVQTEIAKLKFSVLVGQTWLFPTFEENTLKADVDGAALEVKFELDEAVKIAI